MKDLFFRNLARPLLERLGTMLAAYLIARGLDSDAAAQIINGLMAAVLVCFDLVVANTNRKIEVANVTASLKEGD